MVRSPLGDRSCQSLRLEFDTHTFLRQHHILEAIGEPLPRLGVDGDDPVRVDLVDDPGQIFPGRMPRGVKLPLEDGAAPAPLLRRWEARQD